jgi:hypothetical protein
MSNEMRGERQLKHGRRNSREALAAIWLIAALAGCSSSSGVFDTASNSAPPQTSGAKSGSSFSDRMNAFFFGPRAQPGEGTLAQAQPDVDCPPVDIRTGASTYSVGDKGGEPTPTTLRYQATIAQTARECAVLGAAMTIKVGIQGRIILGPTGGPGQIEVPIRVALVQEGVEPKTIWTKFYRVPVTIAPGQTNVPFVHVEEDMTFPTPKPADLDAYVVYVGFDSIGAKEQPRKPKTKPARAR